MGHSLFAQAGVDIMFGPQLGGGNTDSNTQPSLVLFNNSSLTLSVAQGLADSPNFWSSKNPCTI